MENTEVIALIGSLSTLAAVFIGYFLNRNSAKNAVELSFEKATTLLIRQEFIKAGHKFSDTFNNIRLLIAKETDLFTILEAMKTDLLTQFKALVEFEINLPKTGRTELRQAWQDYKRKNDVDFAEEYFWDEENDSWKVQGKKRNLIRKRIDGILHFTLPASMIE